MDKGPQQLALEEEFPDKQLRSTPKGGRNLTYVPAAEVIQRLNNVLGVTGWDWKATRIWRDQLNPDWVIAWGELTCTIDGQTSTKSGSGGCEVSVGSDKSKNPGKIVDLGDEFKGAESDALKKAAQRFGVALYLSRKPEAIDYELKKQAQDEAEAAQRTPQKDGWESEARAVQHIEDITKRIKAQPNDIRNAMAAARNELVKEWPPTAAEYATLEARLADLIEAATRVEPEPQETPPAHQTAEQPQLEAEPTPEPVQTNTEAEVVAAVKDAFPGTEDVSPASEQWVKALKDMLDNLKTTDDVGAIRAFKKWSKEHELEGIAIEKWTQQQVSDAMDFIESM